MIVREQGFGCTWERGLVSRQGFTLIELLVCVGIIALLASLALPALGAAKLRAKIARVKAELYQLGLALDMYSDDYQGKVPPVRVNCNTDLADHWCQFPKELASLGYLPKGEKPGMEALVEDIFNPGHTYKYAAPGPYLLNGQLAGNFRIWVPTDYPVCQSKEGDFFSDPSRSPVRWVIWSMGPVPHGPRANHSRGPLYAEAWFRDGAGGGIIGRTADHQGVQYVFP